MARGHHHAVLQTHKHDHSAPDVLIEFAEKAKEKVDSAHQTAEYFAKAAKFYYGHHAFREYHWLKGVPGLNKSGKLVGMVLDKRARALFGLSVEVGEKLEKLSPVLMVAGWAIELAKSKDYIAATLHSRDDGLIKGQRISAEISMATIRTLTGAIPTTTHLVAGVLLKAAHRMHAPQQWQEHIRQTDIQVDSVYRSITNTDNVVHFVNTHLVF